MDLESIEIEKEHHIILYGNEIHIHGKFKKNEQCEDNQRYLIK